jgi:hypothetical protein
VTQEPHVIIEEETPQSDPKELECNIELWKQREAEASCKHMLAFEKKANQVERELSQLYKEQWPRGAQCGYQVEQAVPQRAEQLPVHVYWNLLMSL